MKRKDITIKTEKTFIPINKKQKIKKIKFIQLIINSI